MRRRPKKIITISRMFGAGGRQVAECLGKALECQVWDKEILDIMASQSGGNIQASMFEMLDEQKQAEIEFMLSPLAGQVGTETYMYLLPLAIHTIAQNDAVIVGRGAHLLIPDAFKVYIKASLETRVNKLMKIDGMSEEEARIQIESHKREREAFLEQLARRLGYNPNNPGTHFDFHIEINTDNVSFQEASNLILLAAERHYKREAA